MNCNPKISVIMPVYNAEKYLNQCLDSLLNQTLKDFEVICINDGSTDSSLEILNSYAEKDNRFRIFSQQNQGAGRTRNNGIPLARGKYVIFLDADDFFESEMLEELYNNAEENNSDVVAFGANHYNNNTGEITYKDEWNKNYLSGIPIISHNTCPDYILYFPTKVIWDKFFRRSHIDKYNLRFPDLKCTEDFYFAICSIGLAEAVTIVHKPFVNYRTGNSDSLSAGFLRTPDDFIKTLCLIKETLKEYGMYEKLERSFINLVMATSMYFLDMYSKIDKEAYVKVAEMLYSKYFAELGVKGKDKSYFISPQYCESYKRYERNIIIRRIKKISPILDKILGLVSK